MQDGAPGVVSESRGQPWSGTSTRDFWLRKQDELDGRPMHNGGSCVVGPDGEWVHPPEDTCQGQEGLWVVQLDRNKVVEERHNFDANGHYSRPDIFRLSVGGRSGPRG